MRQYEAPLWGRLGPADGAQLASTRSRRNRRATYQRLLEDALLVQSLYQPEEIETNSAEPALQREILSWLHAMAPRIPFGVPTRQLIPYGDDTLEIVLLDLRGQAPPRALVALGRAAADLMDSREALGLAVVHGAAGQTDMLQLTIKRWIAEYGRGQVLRPAPSSNGTLLALDVRRVARYATEEAPEIPLAREVEALRELLTLSGGDPDLVRLPNATGSWFGQEGEGDERPKKKRRRRGRGGKGRG